MDIVPNSSSYLPTNSQTLSLLIESQEYFLIYENIIYKIVIGKNTNEIFIKNKNYIFTFNENDLSILTNTRFNSIDEAYDFINILFEENRVIIKSIAINKEIKLLIKTELERDIIKLTLKYDKDNSKINENNNDYIINELTQLKNQINDLKDENIKLKNEIDKLKEYHENNSPKDIKLKTDISNDSFGYTDLDNSFIAFKSVNNISYLIYSNINKAIICYDLNRQKISKQIENSHNKFITNFRHYLDEINKVDLIMSISSEDNNIKIWNLYNWERVLEITNANYSGWLYSACFLTTEEHNNYIISSNRNKQGNCESIKIFDFNGYVVKEINNSKEQTYFIDTYYDNILSKIFIITGNVGYIKSYDYNKNDVYHKYIDFESNSSYCHFSVIVTNNNGKIKIIETCFDGNVRIWNFHTCQQLNKIKISDEGLRGICLWNNDYLFIGCDDKTIKLIEIKNGLIIKSLTGHVNEVITVKKIIHPHFGECLISQNGGESKIKIWK